ncbi:DsbA family protein [Comamonas composti]|uniref:DsbA family protein n=1 Tax=Comamonas composti TaxID=408558 RepID=UPI000478E6C5|nr:DsbA family protein [Comamonas composti]
MNAQTSAPLVLHYIFDPLCGWCYAAAPLVQAARNLPGIGLQWHGGGMLVGAQRREIDAGWREHVLPHDKRISELTGQVFGEAYSDGLLKAVGTVLDSEPPTTAMLAAEQLSGRGLDLLARMQEAYYIQGRLISDMSVLQELARDLGLDAAAFAQAYAQQQGAPTQQHMQQSRQLLSLVQGQGFPSFALEFDHPEQPGQRAVQRIDISPWLADVQGWKAQLGQWAQQVAELKSQNQAPDQAEGCGPDGCALP